MHFHSSGGFLSGSFITTILNFLNEKKKKEKKTRTYCLPFGNTIHLETLLECSFQLPPTLATYYNHLKAKELKRSLSSEKKYIAV